MASTTLTGSYSGSNASNYGIRCVCSSTSNGSTANTSNVTVTLQMRRAVNTGYEGQWSADGTAKGRIIINGSDSGTTSVYFDTRNTLEWITLKTYTVNNIAHNADGSKSITVTAYFEPNATSSLYGGYVSGTFVLDTIPRATTPTLSATSVTMGNNVTITINPASSGFKHKVRYSFGSLSGQTSGLSVGADFTGTGNTTVTFTPPTSLGSQIPNANSGTCTIYCYTYNSSGTQIGNATTKTVTLNIPTYTPSGSITITGNNLRNTAYVAGKSTVTGNVTFSTSYGATIKSVVSTVDGKSYTSSPFTSSALSAGSKSVSVVITDSRNKTKTVTSSAFTVYEYANPYITTFTVERASSDSTGKTVIATLVGGVSAINNQNTKSFKVTLNGVTQTITSSTYTVNGTTTFTNVPTDNTLTATATITDYYTSATKDATLPTVEVTLDFLADGKGIAMGKVAETSNLLDVAWNIKNASVPTLLGGLGKSIVTNSDLNTSEFIIPGNYVCSQDGIAKTLKNTPSTSAFMMRVYNCLDILTNVDSGNYVYLVREIINYSAKRWIQYVRKEGGSWQFSAWRLLIDNDSCKDYVIEQGTSGNWTYRKWNSGIAECWGFHNVTLSGVGVEYNIYHGYAIISLPSIFNSIKSINYSTYATKGYDWCGKYVCNNTSEFNVYILSQSSLSTATIQAHVFGTWK